MARRQRKPDPQPCPVEMDVEGHLRLKATVVIRKENAGAVIGHKGDHVAEVRRESGATVHVCEPQESGAQPGPSGWLLAFHGCLQVGSALRISIRAKCTLLRRKR